MGARWNWKKIVLLTWAVALTFGLSHQISVAAALEDSCNRACKRACGRDNCSVSAPSGCTCHYLCKDGTEGSIICVE